ncbi:MAG: DUF3721 domain-containing protein [Cyanobacteriota bacterium]
MKISPVLQAALAASLLIGAGASVPVQAQANDMFPTKAAAEQRAKQLRCSGAFSMGSEWMPCKDLAADQQAVRKGS